MTKKNENAWPIASAQHIFPSKRYTTYECIPELVVTVTSARSTIVKKIKRFIIGLYEWSRVTFTELLSAVVKIPWYYHHFPWPLLFSMTFQAWKMVFPNSMTFHDQGAPCLQQYVQLPLKYVGLYDAVGLFVGCDCSITLRLGPTYLLKWHNNNARTTTLLSVLSLHSKRVLSTSFLVFFLTAASCCWNYIIFWKEI